MKITGRILVMSRSEHKNDPNVCVYILVCIIYVCFERLEYIYRRVFSQALSDFLTKPQHLVERSDSVGRALDWGSKNCPQSRCVVSLSKTHHHCLVLVQTRKTGYHPDMTEKLLTGTISINTNKAARLENAVALNLSWCLRGIKKCL